MTQPSYLRSSPPAIALLAAVLIASACDAKPQSTGLPPAKGSEAPPKVSKETSPAGPALAPTKSAGESPTAEQKGQRFVGNLDARERLDVAAKTTGVLVDIPVKEGDLIEKGALLFRQQDTQARLAVEQANAAVAQAKVQLAHAERELVRAKDLADRGAAAQAKLDLAVYGRDAALAALHQAEASQDMAAHQVTQSSVRAPIAGTVTHRLQDVGELATMMPPTVVLVLQDLSVLKAKIRVPVHVLPRTKAGDHLDVWISDLSIKRDGTLVRIADVVDPMTRTAELEVHIDNTDRLLKPGMYVEATLGGQAATATPPSPSPAPTQTAQRDASTAAAHSQPAAPSAEAKL